MTTQKTESSNLHIPGGEKKIYIALMGGTGAGKTSFINRISGSNLGVSHGLVSCTDEVQESPPFKLGDRTVVLLDTPGFDDTNLSEKKVLQLITSFLEARHLSLQGVIYVHNINEQKMGGIAVKNFGLFRQLIGDSTLKNVVIVTSHWSRVAIDVGNERVKQLVMNDRFYKPALDKGARMMKYFDTVESAQRIVESIIQNTPRALIQEEFVDQSKDISQTAANPILPAHFQERIDASEKEIQELKDMKQAMAKKDKDSREGLKEGATTLEAVLADMRKEKEKMAEDYAEQKREVAGLRRTLEEQNEKRQTTSKKTPKKDADSDEEEGGSGLLRKVVEAEAEAAIAVVGVGVALAKANIKVGKAMASKFGDVFF